MAGQRGRQLGMGKGVRRSPGWDSGCSGLRPPPPSPASVALCQAPCVAPASCSLGRGLGAEGGGRLCISVKTPGLLSGSPFFSRGLSCPCHSLQEGARDLGRGVESWEIPDWGHFPFPSLSEIQSRSRLPCLPGPAPHPTLHVTLPPTQPPPFTHPTGSWQG